MITVDGGEKSGSGTILRLSIALSSILGEELHIYNIRKKRENPGLRPQHLEATLTSAKLTDADLEGAYVGSRELWFRPKKLAGGVFSSEIGTAGSIPMLFMTVLPICAFSKGRVELTVGRGGTDVRGSPTINYLIHVLLPTLSKMGVRASVSVRKYGYYPVGMGEATLVTEPAEKLAPLWLARRGRVAEVKGVSVSTFLKERRVSERQAFAAEKELARQGYRSRTLVIYDTSNPLQKGSSIVLWAEFEEGAILGGDAIGEPGKPSETVGAEAARKLLEELRSSATVDIHLADMLIPYVALAPTGSLYVAREISEHIDTNLWLAKKILGVEFYVRKVEGGYEIERR